jgi:hypothetical protein
VAYEYINYSKFWEEPIDYFPLIRHGPHKKRKKGDTQTARRSHISFHFFIISRSKIRGIHRQQGDLISLLSSTYFPKVGLCDLLPVCVSPSCFEHTPNSLGRTEERILNVTILLLYQSTQQFCSKQIHTTVLAFVYCAEALLHVSILLGHHQAIIT